ncbi:hypothetical protein M433DRAFT_376628 [Acidomyces richmondensis BFW]|nr:MAG: hypothetical protein FE78DRAFT_28731 [Acidomyces sp. 'richmondensis']KYG48858.1 hypothetical protein M433DRAFT_376628 [Acidomyces richmondensis BFW]
MFRQVLLAAACAAGVLAKSTISAASINDSNTSSATILIGSLTTGFAASIVSADACDTTYQIVCTDSTVCNGYSITADVTEGPTSYQFNYATSTNGASGSYTESCSLRGSTYAVCSQSITLSADGTSTATSTTVTASGSDIHYGTFPITAGASKLASATGSCKSSGNAAAPTGMAEVYKVLVAPAAAAAVLGALL